MSDRVTITPAEARTRFSLRTRSPADLPAILCTAPYGDGHALGLGPDEWLLLLPPQSAFPKIAGPHALTDVSHRNVGFDVSGSGAERVLLQGIALDLGSSAFPVGKVTRTLHEGIEIVLWRTGKAAFRLECWRSFAEHLLAALTLGAGDIGREGAERPAVER